jgi:hypothetical protein
MPVREEINDFQKVVLENFQRGRLAELATLRDYRSLAARLKKEPGTAVLAALIESLRGVHDVTEASTAFLNADIDVKAAMSSVGALAMREYAVRRQQVRQAEPEPEEEPSREMGPSMAF